MTPTKPESAAKSGAVNALVSLVGLGSQQVAAFVITLLAAGYLTAAEYGVYTLSVVFVEFVIMLTYTGFFHFIINSDEEDSAVLSTMFYVLVGIGVIGGAGIFLCADLLANVFDAPDLAPVLRALGLLQPFASIIGWGSAALTRAGLMRRYFLTLAFSNFGALVVGAIVIVVWQSVFALVVFRAVRIVIGVILFMYNVPERPRRIFEVRMVRSAARYAAGLYGARFLTFFSNFGIDLVLALIFSTAEAGLYRFANRLAMATVEIVGQPLRSFSLKSFGQRARSGGDLDQVFALFLGGGVLLIGGTAMTLFILSSAAISTMFLPEYGASVVAVQALCVLAMARVPQNLIEPVFAARKNTTVALYNNLGIAAGMLVVIAVFAPFGFTTLSIAQAGLQLITVPVTLIVIRIWGRIDIGPGVAALGKAVAFVAGYAAALAAAWYGLQTLPLGENAALALAVLAAFVLGGITAAIAMRAKVLSLRMFAD